MQISQAKEIPLYLVVEALGGTHSHTARNGDQYYFSPFRPQERTASFIINEKTNTWHDFGLSGNKYRNGGDIIDLWCDHHNLDRKAGIPIALEALQAYSNVPATEYRRIENKASAMTDNDRQIIDAEPRFKIVKLHNKIFFPEIVAEVQRRRISMEVANLYLKQVYLKDSEKPDRHMNGLAFANMKGGYEISIPNTTTGKSFKTSTRPKAPSFIKGQDATGINIFEGFWDFLSLLEMEKTIIPKYDTYVLNSVSFAGEVIETIKQFHQNIKSILLYLDNDEAGFWTTKIITSELKNSKNDILIKQKSYSNYKDLNDLWRSIDCF